MSTEDTIANPYVGLRPFECEDSLYFFGRRKETTDLLEQLHSTRFLPVVGSSGCGKSSLIRAGLIPAPLGGFLIEERDRWQIATMKPGDAPLRNLATALCEAVEPESADANIALLQDAIAENHTRAVIDYLIPRLGRSTSLLLLVDQFEEIFSFGGAEDEDQFVGLSRDQRHEHAQQRAEAGDFVDLMLNLSVQADLPVYTVLTMRTDFLGDCDIFYGLPEAMNQSRYLVPRLTRQELRQAIEGPALLSEARIAARLLDLLLNELGDRSDRLPILQHALMRAWDIWGSGGKKGFIDLEYYEAAGILENALSQHAEQALRHEDLDITAKIFKCLTDTDLNDRRVRRPSHLSELVKVTNVVRETVLAIIERFREDGRNFLVISAGLTADDPRIDISHESLIRQWDRLKQWVDEERASRDQFRELVVRARGKRALLRDPDLQLALDWYKRIGPTETWAKRYCRDDGDFGMAMQYLDLSRSEAQRLELEGRLKAQQEARLKLEGRLKSGAGWFNWLAGASIFNSIVVIVGGSWGLLFSLGVTQFVDALAQLSVEEHPETAVGAKTIGLVVNIVIASIFLFFGRFARKGHRWAFLIGISLYFLDALLCLWVNDFLSLAFHAWVLFSLFGGLRACKEWREFEQKRTALKSDKSLVMKHGTKDEGAQTKSIPEAAGAAQVGTQK